MTETFNYLEDLGYFCINSFGRRRRSPTIDNLSILIDQEFLKVPLENTQGRDICTTRLHFYLDARKSQDSGLFVLQPLVHFIRVVSIDFRFLHQRESDTMIEGTKLGNALVVRGFLATKLCVTSDS